MIVVFSPTALPEHPEGGVDLEPSWGQWDSSGHGLQQAYLFAAGGSSLQCLQWVGGTAA